MNVSESTKPDSKKYGNCDNEFKLQCLARQICEWNLAYRRKFLEKHLKIHGKKANDELKELVTIEHERRRNIVADSRAAIAQQLKK